MNNPHNNSLTPTNDAPNTAAVIEPLLTDIHRSLEEMKAEQIVELNIGKLTSIADLMIVASGNTPRHVKAIADEIIENAKKINHRPIGVEGTDVSEWILIDYGDIIVHVMIPKTRSFYELEKLWSSRPSGKHTAELDDLPVK